MSRCPAECNVSGTCWLADCDAIVRLYRVRAHCATSRVVVSAKNGSWDTLNRRRGQEAEIPPAGACAQRFIYRQDSWPARRHAHAHTNAKKERVSLSQTRKPTQTGSAPSTACKSILRSARTSTGRRPSDRREGEVCECSPWERIIWDLQALAGHWACSERLKCHVIKPSIFIASSRRSGRSRQKGQRARAEPPPTQSLSLKPHPCRSAIIITPPLSSLPQDRSHGRGGAAQPLHSTGGRPPSWLHRPLPPAPLTLLVCS